jgi:hypothetical protein
MVAVLVTDARGAVHHAVEEGSSGVPAVQSGVRPRRGGPRRGDRECGGHEEDGPPNVFRAHFLRPFVRQLREGRPTYHHKWSPGASSEP